jgi:hypothetical protein
MYHSLKEFRTKFNFEIKRGTSMEHIKGFAEDVDYQNGNLDFEVFLPSKGMNLQRDLVWTAEQKSSLILTVLKGNQLPIFTGIVYKPGPGCHYNDRKLKVIDGKQRLTTLISYYRNEFPMLFEGKEIYYNDLGPDAAREIKLFTPTWDLAHEYDFKMISDEDKIKWFELINFAGTPQDIAHLQKLKSS